MVGNVLELRFGKVLGSPPPACIVSPFVFVH